MEDKDFIESLEKKKEEILSKAAQKAALIDDLINEYKPNGKNLSNSNDSDNSTSEIEAYNTESSWPQKIGFIFRKEQRFLHLREMAEIIMEYEPALKDIVKLKQKLSSNLNRMRHDDILTNIKIGNTFRNTFWGAVKWVDEKGDIKKGFEFDSKYIYKNVKKKDLI